MAQKPTAPKTAAKTIKFEKQGWYADQQGNIWVCTNARARKTPDGHQVVDMQKVENGNPLGEPGEEYTDTFVKKLTKAEVAEFKAICQREADGLAAAQQGSEVVAADNPQPAKKKVAKEPKPAKTPKTDGKLSALDAAAKVLGESPQPMTTRDLIEAMAAKGYWSSPGGKTPAATLYSALIREIQVKKQSSRFAKTDRGLFALRSETPVTADNATKTPRKKAKKLPALPKDGEPGPKSVADLFKL